MRLGTWGYVAGASGTASVPVGSKVVKIATHASSGGATLAINGGDAIPVISGAPPLVLDFHHDLLIAKANGFVFTSTDSYLVEFIKAGNV
jgi:hypothetical protein